MNDKPKTKIRKRGGVSDTAETVTKPANIDTAGTKPKVDKTSKPTEVPKPKPVPKGVGGSYVINSNGDRVKA